ncbi:hypothetical protein Tco_0906827 [Tanacetum coccineum]|uniref:Uncharacterized protein n=1 Tax=Tanacetum coccineum TaxID=301880 RepID=A0ABQ5CKD6_9ASTR
MDPNCSIRRLAIDLMITVSLNDVFESEGQWDGSEFRDTADSGEVVKKELLVALKGELYFVKFIINSEQDDVEPGVVLGRSFLRLAKGIVDLGNGIITFYPDLDSFHDDSDDN